MQKGKKENNQQTDKTRQNLIVKFQLLLPPPLLPQPGPEAALTLFKYHVFHVPQLTSISLPISLTLLQISSGSAQLLWYGHCFAFKKQPCVALLYVKASQPGAVMHAVAHSSTVTGVRAPYKPCGFFGFVYTVYVSQG